MCNEEEKGKHYINVGSSINVYARMNVCYISVCGQQLGQLKDLNVEGKRLEDLSLENCQLLECKFMAYL